MVNIYASNIGAPQYLRQTLTDIKGEMNSSTILVGEFNTPLTPMAEKAMATHSSTLAWKIPGTEEPGRLLVGSSRNNKNIE